MGDHYMLDPYGGALPRHPLGLNTCILSYGYVGTLKVSIPYLSLTSEAPNLHRFGHWEINNTRDNTTVIC